MHNLAKKILLTTLILSLTAMTILPPRPCIADHGKVCDLYMDIQVDLDLEKQSVKGNARSLLPPDREVAIDLAGLDVIRAEVDDRDVSGDVGQDGLLVIPAQGRTRGLFIEFTRVIRNGTEARHTELANSFISPKGAMLLDNWCPTFEEIGCYTLSASVPEGMVAVSEADSVNVKMEDEKNLYTFLFPYPREGISLVAGPYQIRSDEINGIAVRTYFFPEDQSLAESYLEKAKRYLQLYSEMLGPYPFKAFSVVENIAPTGYGFPSYTLLGQTVIRLPFIVDTSLGHEILHNWLGNSVYIDYSQGNWAEGLTTYLADAFYQEEKGDGADYRHSSLVNYQSYVHDDNKMALKDFRFRKDKASKAIGYVKGAMVFHMLKQIVSDDVFQKALKEFVARYRFQAAGWKEIQNLFEEESGKDLSWFFSQWLERSDRPEVTIPDRPLLEQADNGKNAVKFTLKQENEKPYRILVPIVVKTSQGEEKKEVWLKDREKTLRIETQGLPSRVVVDQDFDLMRALTPPEFPPVLSRLYGAKNKFYVMDLRKKEVYEGFATVLDRWGFKAIDPGTPMDEALAKGSILIMGRPWGLQEKPASEPGATIRVKSNPFCDNEVLVYLSSTSSEELQAIVYKLKHYGAYSRLKFKGGKTVEKKKPDYQKGIVKKVEVQIMGIASANLSPLPRIIQDVSNEKVVFVGEQHDQYSNHLAQLKVIKALKERGQKVAVGMEMFQRPFQEVIDRYLDGKIDERTFLKETEYFSRWGYDYHLYRPIIQYCKENKIPIVALNIRTEISKKVAREGLDALTEEEKKEIPEDIDLSNEDYKAWLQGIYQKHTRKQLQNFEYFYQAQVLWDEAMARSACEFLKEHPDYKMVILAGVGHMAYGYGIPSRIKRRGGYTYSILLNSEGRNLEPSISDFFLFPGEMPPPFSAKLGVLLKEEDDKVIVQGVMPQSAADEAGIKKGDIILDIDGGPVNEVSDLKIALVFKNEGDFATIRLKRIRRFAPDKTMDLKIGPFTQKRQAHGFHR